MAQTKIEYGKVVAPRPLGAEFTTNRMEIFKFLMIFMVLLTIVSVFHVWSRYRLMDLNLQISEASSLLKTAEQEQKRLKLEAASLKTPARIESIAKNELSMALPTEQQVVQVK